MKKYILLICIVSVFFVLISQDFVYATGGGLRKESIKTCPDGVTYGEHSDGHGGTHWHIAITNGKNYYASGGAIANDPCPGSYKNEGTAGPTSGSKPTSGDNETAVAQKSDDTSISEVIIDGNDILVAEKMTTKVSKKYVSILILTTDIAAKATFSNRELKIGENQFSIIVTAESGIKKEYTLNIIREEKEGSATIQELIVAGARASFIDYKASISVSNTMSGTDFSYKLSDENATLSIYLDNVSVGDFRSLDDSADYRLVVADGDGNEKDYYLHVEKIRASSSESNTASSLVGMSVLGLSTAGVIAAFKSRKK